MPTQKHALVVDDSKSARLVLRRMLEKHGLAVDTRNSASEALDFLIHNRPDVIFMDHMMPGMDGFEAVKAIKNNPATATIPILMYTSKGGDLYLGQARALGAVGILPKTVAPAELFGSLERLGLVRDRRGENAGEDEEQASERAHDIERRTTSHAPFLDPEMPVNTRPPPPDELDTRIRKLLEEQRVELRKDILVSMESVSRHVGEKLERELDEKLETIGQPQAPAAGTSTAPLVLLGILLLLSLVWNYSLQRNFAAALDKLQPDEQQAALQVTSPAPVEDSAEATDSEHEDSVSPDREVVDWAMKQSMSYPYDEIALDGERVDTVDKVLERLAGSGFEGNVVLETHTGVFCLLGNEDSGFSLPPAELTLDQCDFIGNPVQPTDIPAAQQSLRFANFYNSTPWLADGRVTLEVVARLRSDPLVEYPPRSKETRAQDWNRVAAQNNQVKLRLESR